MARLGAFDPTARSQTWFDEIAVSDGWFDPVLIGAPASAGAAPPNRPTTFANGHQGVLSLGAAIGGALLFAAAVFIPSVAQAVPQKPAYDVGSQRAVFSAGSAGLFQNRAVFQSVASPALRSTLIAGPQSDTTQFAALTFKAPPASVASMPLRGSLGAAPQPDLTTPAPLVFKPIPVTVTAQSPPLRPMITAAPQFDPSQRAPLTFSAPPPTASTQAQPQPPQIDAGSQRSAFLGGWASVFTPIPVNAAAPTTPPLRTIISAAPQADPSQIEAQLYSAPPPSTAPAVQPQPQPPVYDIGGQRGAYTSGWAALFGQSQIQSAAPALMPAGDLIDQPQQSTEQPFTAVWAPFPTPAASPPSRQISAAPQTSTYQIPALVLAPQPAPAAAQSPLTRQIFAAPQTSPHQTAAQTFFQEPSSVASAAPPLRGILFASPQPDTTTPAPRLFKYPPFQTAVWPNPADVRYGVTYGPNGNDYTGTLVPGTVTPNRIKGGIWN